MPPYSIPLTTNVLPRLSWQRAVAGISGKTNPDIHLAAGEAPARLRGRAGSGSHAGASVDLDDLAAGIGEVLDLLLLNMLPRA